MRSMCDCNPGPPLRKRPMNDELRRSGESHGECLQLPEHGASPAEFALVAGEVDLGEPVEQCGEGDTSFIRALGPTGSAPAPD